MAPFMLRGEARECMKATLADMGGRLVSVLQIKAAKKYRVEVTADLADGSRKRWFSKGIKYPKSKKQARDWAAEASFAAAWHPTEDGVCVERLSDARHNIKAEVQALPAREKRPRDCREHLKAAAARPEKRGGTREGGGRPRGSYGARRLRELLLAYKAAVDAGLLVQAQIASRKLPAAMLEASLEVEKNSANLDPVFLKRQSNRGVGKKTALRKLRLARSKLAKAALEARACRDHWEHAVTYLGTVEKECLGSAAVVTAGHETSVDVSHAQAAKLLRQTLSLRSVYQVLLKGGTQKQAFESTAACLGVAVSTLKTW